MNQPWCWLSEDVTKDNMTTVWGIHILNSQYSVRRDYLIVMIFSRNLTSQGTREIAFFAPCTWASLISFILFASCCIQVIPCAVSLCCLPEKQWSGHLPHSLPQLSDGPLFSPGGGLLPMVPGWPWGWECGQSHRGMHTGCPFLGSGKNREISKKKKIQGTLAPLTLPTIPFHPNSLNRCTSSEFSFELR